ncbi:ABC transporter permease [Devosia sp.]|uniref:ABC transporter permease n=1 Tax=Devosia sp. TaxID=1871048 RepID=UPI002AFE6602|nr:ABC transporter permease [Devosia sp.]
MLTKNIGDTLGNPTDPAPGRAAILRKKMLGSKLFVIGLCGVTIIVLACLLGLWSSHSGPDQMNLAARLKAPEWFSEGLGGYIFGADQLGRDVVARVLIGSRYSISIALSVVLCGTLIGVTLGLVAGYVGGVVDAAIMRVVDIMMTLPTLIVALSFVAVLGASIQNLIIVLSLTSWVLTARVVRGSTLAMRGSDYVSAARVMGASDWQIVLREVLPNVVPPILIMATQQIGIILLTEAGMSFLGMGIPSPTPSWGGMIADGQAYMATAPWVVIAPGMALMLAVLSFNLLGDGLRDILDPRSAN